MADGMASAEVEPAENCDDFRDGHGTGAQTARGPYAMNGPIVCHSDVPAADEA